MAATKTSAIVMTEGRPLPQIIRFSVPLALTGIVQLLVNAADVLVVGKVVRDEVVGGLDGVGVGGVDGRGDLGVARGIVGLRRGHVVALLIVLGGPGPSVLCVGRAGTPVFDCSSLGAAMRAMVRTRHLPAARLVLELLATRVGAVVEQATDKPDDTRVAV